MLWNIFVHIVLNSKVIRSYDVNYFVKKKKKFPVEKELKEKYNVD